MKIKLLFSIVFLSVASTSVFTKSIMNDVLLNNSTQIRNNAVYIETEKPLTLKGSILQLGGNTQVRIQNVKPDLIPNPTPSISTDLPTTLCVNDLVEFGASIRANGNQGNVILRSTFTGNDVDGKVEVWYQSKNNGSWNPIVNPGSNPYQYGPFKLIDGNAKFRIKVKQPMNLTGSMQLIDASTNKVIQELQRPVVVNPPPSLYAPIPDSGDTGDMMINIDNAQIDSNQLPNVRVEVTFTGTKLMGNNQAWYKDITTGEWVPMVNPSGSNSVFGPFVETGDSVKFLIDPLEECDIDVDINLIDNDDNSIISNYSDTIKINNATSNDQISENVKKLVVVYPNPCHDRLNIDIDQEGLSVIEVWSVSGRLVYEEKKIKTKNIILNVENWENGLYLIKAIRKDNTEVLHFIKF